MVERIAWTLIHFVWEGAVVAIVLALLLLATRRGSASLRYGLACLGLILMVACPVITFLQLVPAGPTPSIVGVARSAASHFTMGETIVPESPVFPLLVQIWAVGVVLLSLRFVGTLIHLERWKRRHTSPADAAWQTRVDVLAQRMGISRGIRLLVSDRISVPSAWGVLKSVVVLPTSLLAQLSPAQVETILLHELAHISRHDYLVNLLQTVVETALFYHPAVWWISAVIRRERENCCDDVVIRSLADPMPYARALLQLEERRTMLPRPTLSAKGSNLMNRIARILGAKPAPIRISPLTSTLATLAVVAAVMGGTLQAQAQSPKPKPVPPKVKAKAKAKTTVQVRPRTNVKILVRPVPAPAPPAKPAPAPKPARAATPAIPAKPALAVPPAPAAPPLRLSKPAAAPRPARIVPVDPVKTVNIPITVSPETRVTLSTPVRVENIAVTTSDPTVTINAPSTVSGVISVTQPAPAIATAKATYQTVYGKQLAPVRFQTANTRYDTVLTTEGTKNNIATKTLYGKLLTAKGGQNYISAKNLYGKLFVSQAAPSTASTKALYSKFSTLAPLAKVNGTISIAAPAQNDAFKGNTFKVFGSQGSQNPFGTLKAINAKGGTLFGAQAGVKGSNPLQGFKSVPAVGGFTFGGNGFLSEGEISIETKDGLISLDVKDARLAATLRKLAKQSKLSVVITPGRYEDVTLVLSDVAPAKALQIITLAAGASYKLEGGVYYITPRPGGITATPAR